MTRKAFILDLLSKEENREGLSCQKIVEALIIEEELTEDRIMYLSGSVSSLLRKLVIQEELLKYSDKVTTRKGHIYQLNIPEDELNRSTNIDQLLE